MRAKGSEIPLLDAHLRRLEKSAKYFGFSHDQQLLRRELAERLAENAHPLSRVRLTLNANGKSAITIDALDRVEWSGRVLISEDRTNRSDPFLHHKTTNRQLYVSALERAREHRCDEVLFVNRDGFVTEGAISNVVLLLGGRITTPDEASGLLPGVLRELLLRRLPTTDVRPVSLEELLNAEHIWFCNALRGCREVRALSDSSGVTLWRQTAERSAEIASTFAEPWS